MVSNSSFYRLSNPLALCDRNHIIVARSGLY
jgi:hypothetical protein